MLSEYGLVPYCSSKQIWLAILRRTKLTTKYFIGTDWRFIFLCYYNIMKIILCGSMSSHKEMSDAKRKLEANGHIVEMPNLDNLDNELDNNGDSLETANIKIKNDLIRGYFNKIKDSDAVLAINTNRNNINGYIGGNTFLELGFGYVLNKKVYLLNQYTNELPYSDEIDAIQPIILNGDIGKIK